MYRFETITAGCLFLQFFTIFKISILSTVWRNREQGFLSIKCSLCHIPCKVRSNIYKEFIKAVLCYSFHIGRLLYSAPFLIILLSIFQIPLCYFYYHLISSYKNRSYLPVKYPLTYSWFFIFIFFSLVLCLMKSLQRLFLQAFCRPCCDPWAIGIRSFCVIFHNRTMFII